MAHCPPNSPNRRQGKCLLSSEESIANHALKIPGELVPTKEKSYSHLLYHNGKACLLRSFSCFSSSGVLSCTFIYPLLLCSKGWVTKLQENEEILVIHFIGKAKGPERFLALCNNENFRAGRKTCPCNGLIPIYQFKSWMSGNPL